MPFAVTWMDIEIVILSEVSQTEEDKYHDIAYMWNLKKGYKWTYLQNTNSHSGENKLMVTKGEKGGGRDKLGDWDWHIHTTIYKIDN